MIYYVGSGLRCVPKRAAIDVHLYESFPEIDVLNVVASAFGVSECVLLSVGHCPVLFSEWCRAPSLPFLAVAYMRTTQCCFYYRLH